jgi:hypothetical protein
MYTGYSWKASHPVFIVVSPEIVGLFVAVVVYEYRN